jgi:hypothetical protein
MHVYMEHFLAPDTPSIDDQPEAVVRALLTR